MQQISKPFHEPVFVEVEPSWTTPADYNFKWYKVTCSCGNYQHQFIYPMGPKLVERWAAEHFYETLDLDDNPLLKYVVGIDNAELISNQP